MIIMRAMVLSCLSLVLVACSTGDQQDLYEFMEQTKQRPAGQIDPLPPFVPYRSFNYDAMALRSPFDPPAAEIGPVVVSESSDIEPDLSREKEYLESFNLASLSMVGTLEQAGQLWLLINDGEGSIHRVTTGNYLGKNHGRIVSADRRQIDIVEIVPNGTSGWIERPKVIEISEKE